MAEKYLTLAEVKELLSKEQKRRELSYDKRMALEHAKLFSKLNVSKSRQLIKELMAMERVSEMNAFKIAEILPTHPDDVKSIFAKERFNLDTQEIEQILKLVKKYTSSSS
jgi:DNA-directed RNA polymerase subunit F